MTNDGGRANEPTSYSLQPPQAAPAQPARNPYGPQGGYVPPQAGPQGAGAAGQGGSVESDPSAGRLIGGRYRLVARLGHGGMGTVWRARDVVVDREVAVKEPRVPDHLPERERQTVYLRMQREARAAARISHPSVVTMHDVVIEDGRPWIVMELVRGRSLGDQMQEGTLDPREAARIGLAVLGALAAAHQAGVLHRDVKPDNVLLGGDTSHAEGFGGGRVVLTDFGIAQVEGEQGLTETGAFVGSPEFVAPERVLGQRPGPESDLWSLGVVLYAAVEGMSPYRRSNTPATLQAVLSAEPQAPARGSGPLAILIMQLLRKDPAARPSVEEVRQVLERVAAPPPTALLPATGGAMALRTNRKAQVGLAGGVLAVAAALVLALANPFAGDGPPEGWVVREEGEIVKASLSLPKDYQRKVDSDTDDQGRLTFYDPSGVLNVQLERVTSGDHVESVGNEAKEWAAYYERGADSQMEHVTSTTAPATQQDRTAADIRTVYRKYEDVTDPTNVAYRQLDHLYVNDKNVYWRLSVTMPDKGPVAAMGERFFQDVVKHLHIDEQQL